MKRFISLIAALAVVQACQDPNTPPAGPTETLSGGGELEAASALSGSRIWAVVNANGTLARGSRVTSVSHFPGSGQYEITFNTNVGACAYVATTRNAFSQAIQAYTATGHASTNGALVEIKNQGGGLMDGPFNLVATCGAAQGIRFAVVGRANDLVRATSGTTLSGGNGQYSVRFSSAVSGCAFIASVGDPGRGLVTDPAGVYTGSGANANTVYIETKNPGGGLQPGVPFHLAVICSSTASSRFSVVRANGTQARGSVGNSAIRTATGRYRVSSNRNLNTCATVATRGSVNTSVPFNPSTVEIAPGANSRSVGIQVRRLLAFNGGFHNQSFHAASVC